MNKKPLIITHSNRFHVDEVFAVATLRMIHGGEVDIIRTRDENLFEKADFVVDVGGVYDPKTNRFDHHQEGGAGKRENGVPYSSFGLVWKHFGETLCGSKEIAEEIDKTLVQPIDLEDNGIEIAEPKVSSIYPFGIGDVIDVFRPSWNEHNREDDIGFFEALNITSAILERIIIRTIATRDAKNILDTIYASMEDPRLLILEEPISWKGHVSSYPELLFVVAKNDNGSWRLMSVKEDKNTFKNRKRLPASWAGKTGEDLAKASGVSGALFCHNDLFIAGAKTKEGIMKLAQLALDA